MNLNIREERDADIASVRRVHLDAFPSAAEADLVDALRREAACISLVAEIEAGVVGHILFSPMKLKGEHTPVAIAGLAPMAVQSGNQHQGIGSALVEAGLAACKAAGYGLVAVLGHPTYYPRFGFAPAAQFGLESTYDVPPEVFMVKALQSDVLGHLKGVLQYHPCFDALS